MRTVDRYPEGAGAEGVLAIHDARTVTPPEIVLQGSMILLGDAQRILERLPTASVRCAVTSPPYWGLRDYGIAGQIGLEATLPQYINRLVTVFREMRRVLRPDGTFWLNIGDGYTSGNRGWRAPDKKNPARAMSVRPDTPEGLKPKDLLGVPWRMAFALQQDGWFLRSDIVWEKPNAMPESVKDRPTRSHEYLFLFSQREDYYYDHLAIQEKSDGDGRPRNRRSVWGVNTEPCREAHFATFPPALVEPCILAGSAKDDYVLDPFFGAGTVGVVCQRRGRQFVGIELHPDYVNIAARRLANLFAKVTTHDYHAA
ncbi:MAG: Modification methylase DpnIIB [Lentisphaerae bacterium ADurb.BinA184]|nr:MAG: Modification methylase DpnIIB [Lentisphaerae bacterium ADurb.BinA184]